MNVSKENLGIHAVRRLIEIINGDRNTILKIEVNTSQVIRDSVKKIEKP